MLHSLQYVICYAPRLFIDSESNNIRYTGFIDLSSIFQDKSVTQSLLDWIEWKFEIALKTMPFPISWKKIIFEIILHRQIVGICAIIAS